MSIPTYRQEQEEFLESIMDMLTLSGYKPKTHFEDGDPVLTIKLKEMNGQKLRIYANPENWHGYVLSVSTQLEVRYADKFDEYDSYARFTGDLGLVEGWSVLQKYDDFIDHQCEGGFSYPIPEPVKAKPSLMEKLIARRDENLPGGFVMMSTEEVMESRRSAYDFAF